MTITISVSPEAESKLRERAAASGTDVARYAAQLLEQAMGANPLKQEPPPSSRLAAWDAFVQHMTKVGEQLPAGSTIDDSRDSIYAGRGE
jgi:hypothetical protein